MIFHRPGGTCQESLPSVDEGRQIDQAVGLDPSVGGKAASHGGHVARAGVSVGRPGLWPLDHDGRRRQPLGCISGGHLAAHALAGPPLLVEDPHLQAVPLGRLQADTQVAPPSFAKPIDVRPRFGGETAVAPLGNLVHVGLQPLAALVAVQPEQRAEPPPGFQRQRAKLLLQARQIVAAVGRQASGSHRTERHQQPGKSVHYVILQCKDFNSRFLTFVVATGRTPQRSHSEIELRCGS